VVSLGDVDFERVTVSDVSRFYGRRRALSRVNFECASGEIVGLLGPNGAGKSTLLSVLATLAEPSTGRVRYGAWSARAGGAKLRAKIGFLAHDLQLYPELSARENLEFFAGLYGLDRCEARADAALASAGLEFRADEVVEGFSRGMRQRLALERAMIHAPRLMLFDEPFTGLDEASCTALVDRLRHLRGDGRIVIVATHDLDVVDGVLDREILLTGGKLQVLRQSGTLRERYRAAVAKRRGNEQRVKPLQRNAQDQDSEDENGASR